MSFEILLYNLKEPFNVGTIARLCNNYHCNKLHIIGNRYTKKGLSKSKVVGDVTNFLSQSNKVECYKDFQEFKCQNTKDLIAVEMTKVAIPLENYIPQANVIYVLGAEDGGISKECLNDCKVHVRLYGSESINVACASAIIMNYHFTNLNNNYLNLC